MLYLISLYHDITIAFTSDSKTYLSKIKLSLILFVTVDAITLQI